MRRSMTCAAAAVGLATMLSASAAAQQGGARAVSEERTEGIHEHLDEAEDLVETMLAWRHVLSGRTGDAPPPTAPLNTLISVSRNDVERASALIEAAVKMLPGRERTTSGAPRGDLLAHGLKAQEIARELLPPTSGPVGTSGTDGQMILVDRAALQRLEIELEAMERVAPRTLK